MEVQEEDHMTGKKLNTIVGEPESGSVSSYTGHYATRCVYSFMWMVMGVGNTPLFLPHYHAAEYNALLAWPFKQAATLMLLDQDKQKDVVQ